MLKLEFKVVQLVTPYLLSNANANDDIDVVFVVESFSVELFAAASVPPIKTMSPPPVLHIMWSWRLTVKWWLMIQAASTVRVVQVVEASLAPPQMTHPDWLWELLSTGKSGKRQMVLSSLMISTDLGAEPLAPPDTIIPTLMNCYFHL